jgi:hypothetical protein
MGKKIKFSIIISVLLLLLIAILLTLNTLTAENSAVDYSTYTKAICDENNFCQDYIFTCENGEITSQEPITGAFIQFDKDWVDPRINK